MNRTLIALLLCSANIAYAQAEDGRRQPPEAAIRACDGHAAGETVSFTGPRGDTESGVCEQIGQVLAAKPEFAAGRGGPGGERHARMRAAAKAACEGKAAGDSVSLSLPNGESRTATCQLMAVPTET